MKRGLVMVIGDGRGADRDGKREGAGRGGAPACTTVACDVLGDWGRNYALAHRRGRSDAGRQVRLQADTGAAELRRATDARRRHRREAAEHARRQDAGADDQPKATSKADVLAALGRSNDYGAAVLKEFNDQQLAERVTSLPFLGPRRAGCA